MKTLEDHTLIYDQDCPMCRVYTGAFLNRKWLDKDGRRPFQEIGEKQYTKLDVARAQNEIALINRKTGDVIYGVKSLTFIVTHRYPRLRTIIHATATQWVLQRIYSFISYNRKVIAAVTPTGRNCTPTFNMTYRIAYLVFAWVATSFILSHYTALMVGIVPAAAPWREYLVCGGQLAFQGMVMRFYKPDKLFDYWGNMMTVSLMGALALLPTLLIGHLFHSPLTFTLYFLLIAAGMLLEHMRRMKLLGLNLLPSLGWVLYRSLVLLAILFL